MCQELVEMQGGSADGTNHPPEPLTQGWMIFCGCETTSMQRSEAQLNMNDLIEYLENGLLTFVKSR
ncbi:hypothetical protein J32TS2_27190 [Shouchella clausii]|jgi:hypothetical protein|nr:hypothetical protein WZ76_00225 [Shouchella clausii]PAD46551.1 hypothetical protein CHI09_11805 [Shouchella clausii]PAE80153.1 hypothetical protein CHH77_17760 [Shouchella clausii]PAE91893.1 hypothetical protein CHH70_17080 [Shouchella clausii]PAF08774.1 hypothetical protein CHH65_14420 [Shouchella clausii]